MNDASASSFSAPASSSAAAATLPGGAAFDLSADNVEQEPSPSQQPGSALKLRLLYLDDLLRNLDMAVYSQLSALYYMESVLPLTPSGPC